MSSFTILLRVSSCLRGEKMVSYLIFVPNRERKISCVGIFFLACPLKGAPANQICVKPKRKTMEHIIIIGAGMAGLTAGALLAEQGKKVTILEKNWLPGGCSSSYPRKHYIFESGATTLVGLDKNMPLRYVLDKTGIQFPAEKLEIPMKVYLQNGTEITRFQDINEWIAEAERVFGAKNQRPFWEKCLDISQAVWKISLQQTTFPPSSFRDLWGLVRNFRPFQLLYARYAFMSVQQLLEKYELDKNADFQAFVNEQLLITAQNTVAQVNMLFGATALCYTNFDNYYVPGGLLNMVQPFVEYISQKGGQVKLRTEVQKVFPQKKGYLVQTPTQNYLCDKVLFAIPINDALAIFENDAVKAKFQSKIFTSEQVNGAFTMGAVFHRKKDFPCIHHQIHLEKPLIYTGSHSIFVSTSRSNDLLRCKENEIVINISTHVPDPAHTFITDKSLIEAEIFEILEKRTLFYRKDLIFHHASTPKSWQKWTSRKWGFVGGYPQYLHIKPWQMIDARLDGKGAFICGDSTYPGQGIPGVVLSGIVAVEKMK